jgi:hypothetical protein
MYFTPVVRNVKSVVKSLLEFSKERSINVKTLDFQLISHETLIKKEKDLKYTLLEDKSILTKETLLNPQTTLLQEYRIKIMSLKQTPPNIHITIATNKFKTKAVATIKKGSIFTKNIKPHHIKTLLWEKKLRLGLFIDVFEENLEAQLNKLLQIVPRDKALSKDLKFNVAVGINPIAPVDAKLINLYENKHQKSDSIIDCVDKGELILEYKKEKDGTNGRACNGKFLQMRSPKAKTMVLTHDDTIIAQDQEEAIKYFANDDGYVHHANNHVKISKELTLKGADFKSTANIDGGESTKDISVHIQHKKSQSEDAVGSGVNIDVKELNIDGSVGSNVKITTQELKIDAQTHKNSRIEVENSASVKLHRGDLIAKDAEIEILESGKITAHHSIHIKKMLGGEAIAPVVKIDELLSNATITASEIIEIQRFNGTNNTLIINPDAIESYHKELQVLEEEHENKIKSFRIKKKQLSENFKEHTAKVPRIKTFQKRVLANQKDGKTPMKQDIIRIKEFKRNSEKLQKEQKSLERDKHEIDTISEAIEKIQNKDLYAKIISHSSYDGQSKVIFVAMKTHEEITHIPKGKINTISLVLNEENEKVIKLD